MSSSLPPWSGDRYGGLGAATGDRRHGGLGAATSDRRNVLQVAEFVFGEFRLLEDGTKGSGGNIPGVHR